jgi:hypothetical protein
MRKDVVLKCFDIPIYNQKIWFGIAPEISQLLDSFSSLEDKPDITNTYALSGYIEDSGGGY